MLIKRIYTPEGELDYLSLANTGTTAEQNFSVKLVTTLLGLGQMQIDGDVLTLHTHPEDLRYTIKRVPGRYCLHCGEKLQDDEHGRMARLHVAMNHAGAESPDPNNAAGYVALNHFECVLDPEQHEKFRIKEVARAPHFPLKEESHG